MQLVDLWKRNIQETKWKTLSHYRTDFSNSFIDKKIQILKDFFHPSDLQLNSNVSSVTDPSHIWIIYLLSQPNIGSFQLLYLICDVIEFFKKQNVDYLENKLLNNRGRINKNSFRNDFFEVWFNYHLFQKGIKVNLSKCYRNSNNPENEGFDSYFEFNSKIYIIECTKLKSWREEILSLTYQMVETFYKRLKKFKANPHFEKLTVYAIPTLKFHLGKNEFDKHLNQYLVDKINNGEKVYSSSSKAFEEIVIFTATEELANKYRKIYNSKDNVIEINSKFKDIALIDKSGKSTLEQDKFAFQKLNFNISAKCSTTKSPKDFENFLLRKIQKKIDQHKFIEEEKLVIAVELEKFNGLNSFPVNSIERFDKLRQKIKDNLSIVVVFKDSQGKQLKISIQGMHQNDNLINYLKKQ